MRRVGKGILVWVVVVLMSIDAAMAARLARCCARVRRCCKEVKVCDVPDACAPVEVCTPVQKPEVAPPVEEPGAIVDAVEPPMPDIGTSQPSGTQPIDVPAPAPVSWPDDVGAPSPEDVGEDAPAAGVSVWRNVVVVAFALLLTVLVVGAVMIWRRASGV